MTPEEIAELSAFLGHMDVDSLNEMPPETVQAAIQENSDAMRGRAATRRVAARAVS